MYFLNITPLEAREDKGIFVPIIIALCFAAVAYLISMFIKYLRKKSTVTSTRAGKKNTNLSIILRVTKEYDLTTTEKNFLISICKSQKIPNLEVNLKSEQFSEDFFKTQYLKILEKEGEIDDKTLQNNLATLFSLKLKVDNQRKSSYCFTSTTVIQQGEKITITDENKNQYVSTLLANKKEGLILSIPKDKFNNTFRPQELSKINVTYQSSNDCAYLTELRVIRYQTETEEEIVVTHSNNLKCYQRRKYKRIDLNKNCVFSPVKTEKIKKGSQEFIKYIPGSAKHSGQVLEISGGGCSLITDLNIRKNQYINIEVSIDEKSTDRIIGLIVDNTQSAYSSNYILHIVFVRISQKVRNKIFMKVYNYEIENK